MLSDDLQKEFPGISGFSVRNLNNMKNFYLSYYSDKNLQSLLYEVGWSQHVSIVEKVSNAIAREYYLRATRKYGWTVNVLIHKIKSGDFERFSISKNQNFDQTMPENIREQAKLAIKDKLIFDF